jgi:hypothetical protein
VHGACAPSAAALNRAGPEVARNFKEQGNAYFKGRRFREAAGFYSQGLDAHPDDAALAEALLCNRAACNLELRASASSALHDRFSLIPTMCVFFIKKNPARELWLGAA